MTSVNSVYYNLFYFYNNFDCSFFVEFLFNKFFLVKNIIIHDLMEVFITHDESSPPVPFHLAASTVIIVSTPLRRRDELEPHHASIRIHCVNMFVNKEI